MGTDPFKLKLKCAHAECPSSVSYHREMKGGPIKVTHRGTHTHQPPPRQRMTAREKSDFESLLEANPAATLDEVVAAFPDFRRETTRTRMRRRRPEPQSPPPTDNRLPLPSTTRVARTLDESNVILTLPPWSKNSCAFDAALLSLWDVLFTFDLLTGCQESNNESVRDMVRIMGDFDRSLSLANATDVNSRRSVRHAKPATEHVHSLEETRDKFRQLTFDQLPKSRKIFDPQYLHEVWESATCLCLRALGHEQDDMAPTFDTARQTDGGTNIITPTLAASNVPLPPFFSVHFASHLPARTSGGRVFNHSLHVPHSVTFGDGDGAETYVLRSYVLFDEEHFRTRIIMRGRGRLPGIPRESMVTCDPNADGGRTQVTLSPVPKVQSNLVQVGYPSDGEYRPACLTYVKKH